MSVTSRNSNEDFDAEIRTLRHFKQFLSEKAIFTRSERVSQGSLDVFQDKVTIIVYNTMPDSCLSFQLTSLRDMFPKITIILATNRMHLSIADSNVIVIRANFEGEALNKMISAVKTEFFLYLSEGAVPTDFLSDNSVWWLLEAMEQIHKLDYIGGSLVRRKSSLNYRYLDINCNRLSMCYWVLRQTYEYQYSIGDVMLCEETSSSFMGRVSIAKKLSPFDDNLDAMVLIDFFYTVKDVAVVGLRPEVFLSVPDQCVTAQRTYDDEVKLRVGFMKKHDLERVIDSSGHIYTLPQDHEYDTRFHYLHDGGFLPTRRFEDLKALLGVVADCFEKSNITYAVTAGTALGSIKMRSILPWDSGDIDTLFWGDWRFVIERLKEYCYHKKLPCIIFTLPDDPGDESPELVIKFNREDASPNTLFQMMESSRSELFYVLMNGNYVPIHSSVFSSFRELYGLDYLAMKDHGGKNYLTCKKPGHHACVPKEFSLGAGHWSDYQCR